MDQKFDGLPQSTIRLDGRRLVRGHVSNDWGLRLQWKIMRGEETVATPLARVEDYHELGELPAGTYGVVLQMWKYVNYKKDKEGEFTESTYVDISNPLAFEVSEDGKFTSIEPVQPPEEKQPAAS
jgi:hypothetical protein